MMDLISRPSWIAWQASKDEKLAEGAKEKKNQSSRLH